MCCHGLSGHVCLRCKSISGTYISTHKMQKKPSRGMSIHSLNNDSTKASSKKSS
uniref:Uncharacterized protein n=1 Tax=Arion vulgaris TaxID=1028688 RepID=A0A0B7BQ27_9EUPU